MTGDTSDLIVSVTDLDGVQYVVLSGEMDLATAEGLGDALCEISGPTVLLDMADVRFMDSSGIAELIGARNRIVQDGGDLFVGRLHPNVRRVLEITGLQGLILDSSVSNTPNSPE